MLHAHKTALQNTMRQRMVEIRHRELEYYTGCARNLGNQASSLMFTCPSPLWNTTHSVCGRVIAFWPLCSVLRGIIWYKPSYFPSHRTLCLISVPWLLQSALIAGMAYSGIRYHYLLERQQSYHMTEQDSIEEVRISCATWWDSSPSMTVYP